MCVPRFLRFVPWLRAGCPPSGYAGRRFAEADFEDAASFAELVDEPDKDRPCPKDYPQCHRVKEKGKSGCYRFKYITLTAGTIQGNRQFAMKKEDGTWVKSRTYKCTRDNERVRQR